MKILIVTVFYPPQNAIAAQRPYSWAQAWSEAGHEVTVLTVAKDLERSDLAPQPIGNVRILEASPGGLIDWLRNRRRHLRAEGSAVSKAPSNFSNWLRHRGLLSSVRWPDIFELWVHSAVRAIPDEKFDIIVSTFGPPAAHAVGLRAKKKNPQSTWVCDFRDLWTDNHVYPGFWPFSLLERRAERKLLAACDAVTTVSEALANSLRTKFRKPNRVGVFENGFQSHELLALSSAKAFDVDRLRIVYTGSLHPVQRNPRPILEALSRLEPIERNQLDLVFAGPRESFVELMISEFELSSCVRMVGSKPRTESLRMQRDADVLLILEQQHAANRDGVLTGKLFEYLATGRPIWAVGIDSTTTVGKLIESNHCGRAYGLGVDEIVRGLRALAREGRPKGRDVAIGVDIIHQFDRRKIAVKMLEWIVQ